MLFDFKKEYKEFYLPAKTPRLVEVPTANYIAVRGEGDPNEPDGAYQRAIGVLYAVAYTLKMSRRNGRELEGFFDYVVPPLEGFWEMEGLDGMDYAHKERFRWRSVLRLPDFVTPEALEWAKAEAARKKKLDCSSAEFYSVTEGLCAQLMHLGPFDDEPASVALMEAYTKAQGCIADFSEERLHHEIYLSDARKTAPALWKTVIRHPVRRLP